MIESLENKKKRAEELEKFLSDHEVLKNRALCQKYAKELASLSPILKKYKEYSSAESEIKNLEVLLKEKHDREFIDLARSEIDELKAKQKSLKHEMEEMLVEEDPDSRRNIIMEIRAGTGGLEASLFAAELFRMYSKYAQRNNWKVDLMNTSGSEAGGIKEVIFSVEGNAVYKRLKFESGVHRVQRVPTTEASGRIHTSAVTVAVLPEAEEVDLQIDQKDLRVDVYRSSGHGGQSVNTTDSAVRITHIPTDIVVTCQDERSQLKNKTKAMKVLRSRLFDKRRQEQMQKISQDRKIQVGSGDRSEKIRTYNFPDRRVTDHRINLSLHKLEGILEGELDEIISELILAEKKAKLEKTQGE
ncbi:MAG: peptide chain release factor 1 [Candidatus Omnitrophica bacterium]|nr:peptide chain release factor 1 [Candidatus Omnitrophota bacterium]